MKENYSLIEKIGEGNYGEVYSGTLQIAIKRIPKKIKKNQLKKLKKNHLKKLKKNQLKKLKKNHLKKLKKNQLKKLKKNYLSFYFF